MGAWLGALASLTDKFMPFASLCSSILQTPALGARRCACEGAGSSAAARKGGGAAGAGAALPLLQHARGRCAAGACSLRAASTEGGWLAGWQLLGRRRGALLLPACLCSFAPVCRSWRLMTRTSCESWGSLTVGFAGKEPSRERAVQSRSGGRQDWVVLQVGRL